MADPGQIGLVAFSWFDSEDYQWQPLIILATDSQSHAPLESNADRWPILLLNPSAVFNEIVSMLAALVPTAVGLQTMVDKPGVGTVIVIQERDTAVFVERPAFIAALQSAVSVVASLVDRPLSTVVVSSAVSDRMTAVDVALATLSLVPQALSVAVFVDRSQIGAIVILPAVTDTLVGGGVTFNEIVTITETIVASVLDRLVGIDRPSVMVVIASAALGLQTMQEKPGVGTILVVQERDTVLLVDRLGVVLGVSASERDWRELIERPAVTAVIVASERDFRTLTERPAVTAVIQPAIFDVASLVDRPLSIVAIQPAVFDVARMVETASVLFALVPQAVSVAVFQDKPQVGAVIILPGVTDQFFAVAGPKTFNEIVTITETIVASVSDRLVAADRPIVLVTLTPGAVEKLTEFLAGRLGRRIVSVDPSGRIHSIVDSSGRIHRRQ